MIKATEGKVMTFSGKTLDPGIHIDATSTCIAYLKTLLQTKDQRAPPKLSFEPPNVLEVHNNKPDSKRTHPAVYRTQRTP